jgi:hypothetical protein
MVSVFHWTRTRERIMSMVFVHHTVANYDAWRPGFDDHGRVRREYGLVDAGLYRGADDPNDVTIMLTTDDVTRAQEFLSSDNLREAMGRLGVIGAPDIWIAEEV